MAFLVNVVVTRSPPPSISSSLKPSRMSSLRTMVRTWPLLAAVLALLGDLREGRQPLGGLVGLLRRDRAGLRHVRQDVLVALAQVGAGLLAVGRVVGRRVVQHRREHRALAQRQVLGLDVEVGAGGRLDAVGAAAEVDGVEVALEDLGLALLALDLQRQERLLDLALEGLVLGQVEDLDVLLGDRGGTLGRVAAGVAEGRAEDALGVDALVGPEALVLGGDDRVLDGLRHLLERDDVAVLRGVLAELGLAVAVVDERRLGLEVLVGVRDVDGLVEEDEAGRPRRGSRPGRR